MKRVPEMSKQLLVSVVKSDYVVTVNLSVLKSEVRSFGA